MLFGENISLMAISFEFLTVVKLLAMMVVIFIIIPLAAAILFRLLVPLFIVDMPRRHGGN